jgi:hypothetical protein
MSDETRRWFNRELSSGEKEKSISGMAQRSAMQAHNQCKLHDIMNEEDEKIRYTE